MRGNLKQISNMELVFKNSQTEISILVTTKKGNLKEKVGIFKMGIFMMVNFSRERNMARVYSFGNQVVVMRATFKMVKDMVMVR
jgi:hypothetical protein